MSSHITNVTSSNAKNNVNVMFKLISVQKSIHFFAVKLVKYTILHVAMYDHMIVN